MALFSSSKPLTCDFLDNGGPVRLTLLRLPRAFLPPGRWPRRLPAGRAAAQQVRLRRPARPVSDLPAGGRPHCGPRRACPARRHRGGPGRIPSRGADRRPAFAPRRDPQNGTPRPDQRLYRPPPHRPVAGPGGHRRPSSHLGTHPPPPLPGRAGVRRRHHPAPPPGALPRRSDRVPPASPHDRRDRPALGLSPPPRTSAGPSAGCTGSRRARSGLPRAECTGCLRSRPKTRPPGAGDSGARHAECRVHGDNEIRTRSLEGAEPRNRGSAWRHLNWRPWPSRS